MTIKKSLISVATAGLLVAGITGCGSSDGSTTTTGVQSSTQAVDGYIYNAKATAYYLADDNKTMKSIEMVATDTTKDILTQKITLGSSTYALPATDANITSRIKFFAITSKGSTTDDTTFTPVSYIEADGIDGYNETNDTALGTTVIYAPANSKIASPITSMIVAGNPAIFGTVTDIANGKVTAPATVVDLNDTTFTALESNATALAKQLGLGNVDLLTADPVATGKTNPTFKLVNALLKDANKVDFDAIMAATPATEGDLGSVLDVVAKASSGATNGAKLAKDLSASVKNGGFSTNDIANMNIEKSVTSGNLISLEAPTLSGKFPITDITMGSVSIEDFTASGAKIKNDDFKATITFAASMDKNISTTPFKLVVAINGDKDFVAQPDSNLSGALVVELPFDLNSTDGTIATNISAGTLVPYEVKASDGSEAVYKKDVNASTLDVNGTNVVSVNTTAKSVSFDIKTLLTNLRDKSADANLTNSSTGLSFDKISSLQVYLVDVDGKVISVSDDGKSSYPLAKGTLDDVTGNISATEAIKIINLGDVDLRSSTLASGANKAPTIDANITIDNNASMISKAAGVKYSGSVITYGDTVVFNEKQSTLVRKLSVKPNDEGNETNSTIVMSTLPAWMSATKSTLVSSATKTAVDFNVSIDTNATVTGHDATLVKFTITDEFLDTNTSYDRNVTFMMNHAPKFTTNNQSYDVNISGATAADANTSSIVLSVTDDDAQDLNTSEAANNAKVNITKYYSANGTLVTAATDINFTSDAVDSNLSSVTGILLTTGGIKWDVNVTDSQAASNDGNFTITYNVTDRYDLNSTEKNATIKVTH